jgi:hypothetical protein
MPPAQWPFWHSLDDVQPAPSGFFPQLPSVQVRPLTQSADVAQVVRQRAGCSAGSHRNGAQVTVGPGTQLPSPSQIFPPSIELPLQVPSPHGLPFG